MKIRIQMHRMMSLEHILFFVALFCVVSFALLENMSITIPAFSQVKNPLLYLAGICVLSHIFPLFKVLKKKKYFYVMLVLALFCGILYLFSELNDRPIVGSAHQRGTVRLILYLADLFFLMIWAAETGRGQKVLNFLFVYFLIMTFATDLLLFTSFIVFSNGGEIAYLVGTKFTVAYFHINLLTFWFIRKKQQLFSDRKAKRIMILGFPVVVFISIYVDCLTGIFGCIVMLIMFAMMNTPFQRKMLRLNSPAVLVLALTGSVLFPFLAEQIVSIPFVADFLQNTLNKNVNLTGRLNIYMFFAEKMQGHWLLGYGYGNANTAAKALFGYANTQNGLLQWIFQIGVPSTLILVLLMVTILYWMNKSKASLQCMPLVILIYLYIFIGMIEITFDMSFLLWFALLFMLSAESNRSITTTS